jgi:general L-amino acid transport system permease protein
MADSWFHFRSTELQMIDIRGPTRSALHDVRIRSALLQILLVAVGAALLLWLAHNTVTNLAERGIRVGFGFLSNEARFPISQSILPYEPTDSFAWSFAVGLSNTLFLSLVSIAAATLLGFLLALGRKSVNPLATGTASVYVETVRNTPLVVQLLFWYALLTIGLPEPHRALQPLPGIFLTNRGLYLPSISFTGGWPLFHLLPARLGRFNFEGGLSLTPEFAAIATGLTFYSAAYIGEIIRGGLDAVDLGQWQAARALGLSHRQALRHVIVPQAMRVIIPPLTSQYVNIAKNSTLALVVGYPDLAFVTATTINQSGQALEGVAILMLVFLAISLSMSSLMGWYGRRQRSFYR